MDWILAFDNGVSANGIALLGPNTFAAYHKLPVKKEATYTKVEKNITRIDVPALRTLIAGLNLPATNTLVLLERPMINPRRFTASLSAIRALEAELIVLEEFGFQIQYVDSKEWQGVMLPDIFGSDLLKEASLALGQKLYPAIKFKKDADSMLMAHWGKYKGVSTKKKEL